MGELPGPGWHRDPSGAPRLRFWDGWGWTADVAPIPQSRGVRVVVAMMALIAILAVLAVAASL